MLLDHTSGLKSYVPIYQMAHGKAKAINILYAQPLIHTPGDTAVYSDLNALLLGLVVEKVAGTSIDHFANARGVHPLGMGQTMFKPPKKLRKRIAPSGLWRGQPVAGEVNDQNAVVFGGVAGHAGVFSTAADLARFAQVWLRGGVGPQGQWVSFQTLSRFLSRGVNTGSRLLGWDTRERVVGEPVSLATSRAMRLMGTPGSPARCSGSIRRGISSSSFSPIGPSTPRSPSRSRS